MFYTVEKIEKQLKEIRSAVRRETCEISHFKFIQGEWSEIDRVMRAGVESPDYDDQYWADFKVGDYWGGYDHQACFRTWVTVPPEWRSQKLALRFLVGPRDGGGSTAETLLYVNGAPLQAIDIWHEDAWLPPEIGRSGEFFVALKAWSGVLEIPARRQFKLAQLVWIDQAAESFYHLAGTLLKAIKELDENDLRRVRLLQLVNAAFLMIDFNKPRSNAFYNSVTEAGHYLHAGVAGLETVQEIKPRVVGIGHAHIDMAWLWRLRHSREKGARTFTTALHLMRQYPEYRFMHSSPQLYKFLKEDYPQIYERVKERIAAGQWEITGGMWVEADTNLTSGESLVRQLLLGKQFAREEFGVDMNLLWLPDVFGYSAALPQIVKKSGMSYFLTSKISWNQFNRFPYDTFIWRGIDGTPLLTHFVTTPEKGSHIYTYNGQLQPDEVKGIWDVYQQKETNDELLMLYGWGDGGGGPTQEMIESARGLRNLPGVPQVELGKAEEFFQRLEKRLVGKPLPAWDGELYLEYHRGTYTSQAQNKRFNRKAEILFHQAEWLSSITDIVTGGQSYPSDSLRTGWELILLNQFHDILPGSSIHSVYEDSYEDYQTIFQIGRQALESAERTLFSGLARGQQGLLVMNSLSWKGKGLAELPWQEDLEGKVFLDTAGRMLATQVVRVNGEKKLLVEANEIPPLGYQVFGIREPIQALPLEPKQVFVAAANVESPSGAGAPAQPLPQSMAAGEEMQDSETDAEEAPVLIIQPGRLENSYYRIEINEKGQIASLWDKRQARPVLAPGAAGNVFQAFEDKPMNFDAWDIDIYYQEKMQAVENLLEATVEETGPLRGVLRLRWRYYDSFITQRLTIYQNCPRIDFCTQVDWHEQQVLLKVAFPVEVHAARATYDIQFGNLERPTHWNTSWDTARFEVVGHKWADFSEGDYGVGLLNDCKYGYDIKDNVMRLTLIKSAIEPDPQADQGLHTFTYSLLPHAGDWRNSDLVQEAYALNVPLLAAWVPGEDPEGEAISLPQAYGFAEVEAGNVILETVKRAEAGGGWIVRLYEYKAARQWGLRLRFGQAIIKALECNLVEEGGQPAKFAGNTLEFDITPYEIKTFRIWF